MPEMQSINSGENADLQTEKEEVATSTNSNEEQVANPPSQNSQSEEQSIDATAMLELEETLKSLPAEEVLRYQRELSAEMGENLFEGPIGELFKKYKPALNDRQTKVKNVANLMKNSKKPENQSVAKTNKTESEEISNLRNENLKSKIQLELIRNGVSDEFLEEATLVAQAKVKDVKDIAKVTDIASKFAKFSSNQRVVPQIQKTSIEIGGKSEELTPGQKAVKFLRSRNPNGYK